MTPTDDSLLPPGVKAAILTPLELNSYRFTGRNTPLTPRQLEASGTGGDTSQTEPASPLHE